MGNEHYKTKQFPMGEFLQLLNAHLVILFRKHNMQQHWLMMTYSLNENWFLEMVFVLPPA
jgi:hypothetical protein